MEDEVRLTIDNVDVTVDVLEGEESSINYAFML